MESATLLTLRVPDFEAAVRTAAEPRLAARPAAVVTSFRPMGRVVSVNPAARGEGVEEGMRYQAARERCPDAAFFTPDRQLAEEAMRKLANAAGAYSPRVEAIGGGYVLLDTRGTEKLLGDSLAVAAKAQRAIGERLRLPIAAGLATRRPWSLLASRAAGDRDIRRVEPGGEEEFLNTVPVAWIDGVTAKTRTVLMEMNIRTVGQLRQFDRESLARRFGSGCGDALWSVLHPGRWLVGAANHAAEIADDAVRVEAYLPEASAEAEKIRLTAATLTGRAAEVLRARGLGAARLRLTLLHSDGVMKNACAATGGFIQDEALLAAATLRLLERVFQRRVRVSRLWLAAEKLSAPERQGVLFPTAPTDDGSPDRAENGGARELLHTLDRIRSRYGDGVVRTAALL